MAPAIPSRVSRLLLTRFAVLSFLCVIGLALVMGFALSTLLTRAVSEWEWENTAAYVRREVELADLDELFRAAQLEDTRARWQTAVPRLFTELPEIMRVKVWDRQATVLWSDEPQLIGRRFPDNGELQTALAGAVAVELSAPHKTEQTYEQAQVPAIAEIYVPVRATGGEVLGVVEVYKAPVRLYATIQRGRLVIWTISLAGGLALYLVLLPLVRQVYGREVREATLRAHAAHLEAEVAARTDEVRLQAAQLAQAQKMEAVGLLARGVAHDFGNLLSVIQGQSQLLEDSFAAENPLRRRVELIGQAAESAGSLTRQLLTFSRTQVQQPEVLDLNTVVSRMAPMLCRLVGDHVELETRLSPGLGAVRVDPSQLEQVILNLVMNARDAMPHGGRLMLETATVGADRERAIMLAVGDTGVGMDVATQARIFEPFFTTKGPGKGTGLGLATVYGIVQQSGGRITVESEPGHGATFRLCFPPVAAPSPAPIVGDPAAVDRSVAVLTSA
jgi:signal transduction histidine kinase